MRSAKPKLYEDEAIVLDILPSTRLERASHIEKNMLLAQVLGVEHFTLLEAAINQSLNPRPGMRIYIGKDVPRPLIRIVRRMGYHELTENAKYELERAVEELVKSREERIVQFINTCGPLTPRLHALEALPGIGRKLSMRIIEERSKEPFKSFADIEKRIGIQNVDKIIIKRIIQELSDPNTKHWLFTRPPAHQGI
ncbi:hypothetical protein HRbin02_01792 [Candidatus Calditenuaceae archaeon HR02]|nr:hypothetical protein HRbin02_01792 [Candidatus Calditenuaceae archaeon HR02]